MPPRAHVIVLPGGGYATLSDHEGEPVVAWLTSLGLEAAVLRYPVATRHPAVLDAVRAEVRRVRAGGVERVAVLGFSAGGHAAGHAATAPGAAADERVDLAILCYPVVSMLLPTHAGSRLNLLGADASPALRAATSVDQLVTRATPPMFLWHTAEDAAVPVQHSYLLGMALAAAGVPHELHVYERGRHGLGLVTDKPDGVGLTAAAWTAACAAWLRAEGWVA